MSVPLQLGGGRSVNPIFTTFAHFYPHPLLKSPPEFLDDEVKWIFLFQ